jgi:hypothetical protein
MLDKQQFSDRHIVLKYDDQFSTSDLLESNRVLFAAARQVYPNFCAKKLWVEFVYCQPVSDT